MKSGDSLSALPVPVKDRPMMPSALFSRKSSRENTVPPMNGHSRQSSGYRPIVIDDDDDEKGVRESVMNSDDEDSDEKEMKINEKMQQANNMLLEEPSDNRVFTTEASDTIPPISIPSKKASPAVVKFSISSSKQNNELIVRRGGEKNSNNIPASLNEIPVISSSAGLNGKIASGNVRSSGSDKRRMTVFANSPSKRQVRIGTTAYSLVFQSREKALARWQRLRNIFCNTDKFQFALEALMYGKVLKVESKSKDYSEYKETLKTATIRPHSFLRYILDVGITLFALWNFAIVPYW
jgi:hypothetical protein